MFRGGPSAAVPVTLPVTGTAQATQAVQAAEAFQQVQRESFDAFSDMLADLGRLGQPDGGLFNPVPLSTGTADADVPGRFIDGSYTNDAGTRDYKLYVPASYTGQPSPLLVMLHGCSQHPEDFALGTGMNALAEEWHCLVAYPAQSQLANPTRCWNWFNAVDQQRDQGEPAILAGMTRDLMARYAIDGRQVYVAGLSAGGAMAAILGTQYPDLYAAVGVHSGLPFAAASDLPSAMAAMQGDFQRANTPGQTLPIIVFHGDWDTTVHPANGEELMRQRELDPDVTVDVEPGEVPDGHTYTRTVHRRADGTVDAEHWVVHGSGHAWSGGDLRGSYTDRKGPSASREMMRFFHTRR